MNSSSEPLLVSLSLVLISLAITIFSFYTDMMIRAHLKIILSFLMPRIQMQPLTNFHMIIPRRQKVIKWIHRNTTYKDTLSYLQSLNGVYTKIALPGLEDIKKDPSFDKIAVNKARLIIPVYFNPTATDQYISKTYPLNLRLRYKANTGLRYDVPDYTWPHPQIYIIIFLMEAWIPSPKYIILIYLLSFRHT